VNGVLVDRRVRFLSGGDDDKRALLDLLDKGTVGLLLADLPSWHDQVLAITLVDLLGRLFPRLALANTTAQSDPSLPPGPASLYDRLAAARAHGGLARVAPGTPDLTIAVGAVDGPADVFVAATGWQTYLGPVPGRLPETDDRCSVGPVAAACRAAAVAFTRILGELAVRPEQTQGYADILTYAHGPEPLPEGDRPVPAFLNAMLVGAGSVGGAVVHTLKYLPALEGRLAVIDPQPLEPDNPGRALLATAAAAAERTGKVDVARDGLAHHGIVVDPARKTVTQWHAEQPPRTALPLVLTAVDTAKARRAIQDCLPYRLINAACSPDEVQISGHVTGDGPCVCCLQMPQVTDRHLARKRMIAAATGLPEDMVSQLVTLGVPLEQPHLQQIERTQDLPGGSLAQYVGRPLLDVWNEQLIYGGTLVRGGGAMRGIVANAFVTALAGVLVAAEALKHDNPIEGQRLLGPTSETQYRESPYAGPLHGTLDNLPRWPTDECLCRSTRRALIASQIYGTPIPS
jgi:hypothetical protein